MFPRDDPGIGPGTALTDGDNFTFDPQRVAQENRLRESDFVETEIDGVRVHLSHGHEVGSPTPAKLLARYSADVVVYGHTHRPLVVQVQDRWVVNPGAAGPRRFDLKPSVGRMSISNGAVAIEIVDLDP